eukprot:gene25347-41474_t
MNLDRLPVLFSAVSPYLSDAAVLSEVALKGQDLQRGVEEKEQALIVAEDAMIGEIFQSAGLYAELYAEIRELQRKSADITQQCAARDGALLFLEPVLRQLDSLSVEAPEGPNRRELQQRFDQTFLAELKRLDDKINYRSELQRALQPRLLRAALSLASRMHAFLRAKLGALKESSNIKIQQQTLAHRCAFCYRLLR